MKIVDRSEANLAPKVEAACSLIAPLWPLKNFVAVNPYFGLGEEPFWQAGQILKKVAGTGLTMSREYYLDQIRSGRITREDISEALRDLKSSWNLDAFDREMARKDRPEPARLALLSDVLGSVERQDWSAFVVERISQFCAAYFDEGQAIWPFPWKKSSLYGGWREYAALDRSSAMMGLRGMAGHVAALPASPDRAISWSIEVLGIPQSAVGSYLHAALLSIGGWAGWARYRRWQAELKKEQDDTIRDLRARIDHDARVQMTVCANTHALAQHHARIDVRMVTDGDVRSEHGVRADVHLCAQVYMRPQNHRGVHTRHTMRRAQQLCSLREGPTWLRVQQQRFRWVCGRSSQYGRHQNCACRRSQRSVERGGRLREDQRLRVGLRAVADVSQHAGKLCLLWNRALRTQGCDELVQVHGHGSDCLHCNTARRPPLARAFRVFAVVKELLSPTLAAKSATRMGHPRWSTASKIL